MKKLITTTFSLAMITLLSSSAAAEDDTFTASISLNSSTTTEMLYAQIKKEAAKICRAQAQKAGFRATESTSWQQRKCRKEVIKSAVKNSRNKILAEYHNSGEKPDLNTQQFAAHK